MPSVLARIASTWASTALVRSSDAPAGSVTLTPRMPWSSSGMNPAGSRLPKKPAPTATNATSTIVRIERRTRIRQPFTYAFVDFSKTLLKPPKNFPRSPRAGFAGLSSMAARAGDSDSALKADSSTEIAIVSANCWYIRPVRPGMKATGMNTAERMSAMPMTGAETSFIAWTVASCGLIPCSMWCITASTTTIASSTTMPIASTRPNIESVFTEKPSSGKKMKVPMSETGTVSSGMIVARRFCRKMKTTSVTRITASTNVWTIDSIEASTAGVVS